MIKDNPSGPEAAAWSSSMGLCPAGRAVAIVRLLNFSLAVVFFVVVAAIGVLLLMFSLLRSKK